MSQKLLAVKMAPYAISNRTIKAAHQFEKIYYYYKPHKTHRPWWIIFPVVVGLFIIIISILGIINRTRHRNGKPSMAYTNWTTYIPGRGACASPSCRDHQQMVEHKQQGAQLEELHTEQIPIQPMQQIYQEDYQQEYRTLRPSSLVFQQSEQTHQGPVLGVSQQENTEAVPPMRQYIRKQPAEPQPVYKL